MYSLARHVQATTQTGNSTLVPLLGKVSMLKLRLGMRGSFKSSQHCRGRLERRAAAVSLECDFEELQDINHAVMCASVLSLCRVPPIRSTSRLNFQPTHDMYPYLLLTCGLDYCCHTAPPSPPANQIAQLNSPGHRVRVIGSGPMDSTFQCLRRPTT